MIRNNRSNM